MQKIRCVVERITYQNPENGYSVLKCRVKDYSELVPVIGNMIDANVGSVLVCDGNWKVDAKYGRQFVAENWEETLPATVYGMEKYLGSGLIKGVGPKFAKKIVQKYGADTFAVIEDNVETLIEIEGIGKKRVQMIAESWERQKEVKNIMLFLQEHQVSTSYAAKIYKQYGNDSISVMKENPYKLADDIWGIGFKTADQIAMKLGFGKESYVRLRSGLMYTLSELSNDGHVFAEKQQLIDKASELLEASQETVIMTMDDMLQKEELILEKNIVRTDEEGNNITAIYLPPFFYAEVGVAGKLKKLASSPAGDKLYTRLMEARKNSGNEALSVDIEAIQQKTHMEYDEVQADAIRTAATAKVMVLTGGPGTGKTTTTHGIISAYRAYGLRILLAAPTGRAAKRMTEATGLEAKTIHRLLECKPPEGYQKNEENPLEGDVLIVDECSMIDIVLMNSLLKAIPPTMRLIMVGDIDQLPSVGAGNVLRDIIATEKFAVVTLDKVYRQSDESDIITNAHKINRGEEVNLMKKSNDFFYAGRQNAQAIIDLILSFIKDKLPNYLNVAPEDIQLLTPSKKGMLGSVELNKTLQEKLNPKAYDKAEYQFGADKLFREGDKVMQIKNNYQLEWKIYSNNNIVIESGEGVFNGDMGVVTMIDRMTSTLRVRYDDERYVDYPFSGLGELEHAYAVTVHKSQGSEYPAVVIPLLRMAESLMTRNILYTAITRAKQCVVIVGSKEIFNNMIHNDKTEDRNSSLTHSILELTSSSSE